MISIYIDPPASTDKCSIQREAKKQESSRPLLQMDQNTSSGLVVIPLVIPISKQIGQGGQGRTKVLAKVVTKGHQQTCVESLKSVDQPGDQPSDDEIKKLIYIEWKETSIQSAEKDDDDETEDEARDRESRHRVHQAALFRDTRFGWRSSRLGWNV